MTTYILQILIKNISCLFFLLAVAYWNVSSLHIQWKKLSRSLLNVFGLRLLLFYLNWNQAMCS